MPAVILMWPPVCLTRAHAVPRDRPHHGTAGGAPARPPRVRPGPRPWGAVLPGAAGRAGDALCRRHDRWRGMHGQGGEHDRRHLAVHACGTAPRGAGATVWVRMGRWGGVERCGAVTVAFTVAAASAEVMWCGMVSARRHPCRTTVCRAPPVAVAVCRARHRHRPAAWLPWTCVPRWPDGCRRSFCPCTDCASAQTRCRKAIKRRVRCGLGRFNF